MKSCFPIVSKTHLIFTFENGTVIMLIILVIDSIMLIFERKGRIL